MPKAAKKAPATRELLELLVREHRQPGGEHLAEPVRDEAVPPSTRSIRSAEQEADPGEQLRPSSVCESRRARDEQARSANETEEGRGVDVEDGRRAERRDEHAAATGPGATSLCSRPRHGVGLGDGLLVVADELGQDQPLRREVRRDEDADERDEHGSSGKVRTSARAAAGSTR